MNVVTRKVVKVRESRESRERRERRERRKVIKDRFMQPRLFGSGSRAIAKYQRST